MTNLEISSIDLWQANSPHTLAYGMVTFNEAIVVKINIIKARNGGKFVAWPQRKKTETENKNDGKEYVNLISFKDFDKKKEIDKYITDIFDNKFGKTEIYNSEKPKIEEKPLEPKTGVPMEGKKIEIDRSRSPLGFGRTK